jgi:hypothetical protein
MENTVKVEKQHPADMPFFNRAQRRAKSRAMLATRASLMRFVHERRETQWFQFVPDSLRIPLTRAMSRLPE